MRLINEKFWSRVLPTKFNKRNKRIFIKVLIIRLINYDFPQLDIRVETNWYNLQRLKLF